MKRILKTTFQHKMKIQNYIQEEESIKVSVEIVEIMDITEVNVYKVIETLKGVTINIKVKKFWKIVHYEDDCWRDLKCGKCG